MDKLGQQECSSNRFLLGDIENVNSAIGKINTSIESLYEKLQPLLIGSSPCEPDNERCTEPSSTVRRLLRCLQDDALSEHVRLEELLAHLDI